MLARVARAFVVLAVAAAAATGCVGSPEPRETTPTPLTDEQAFAAAEETYRAYIDALNHVDLSDPTTFEPVYAWTQGSFEADERRSLSEMHADRWTISGSSVLAHTEAIAVTPTGSVRLEVCVDVSQVRLLDTDGNSVAASDRPDMQELEIELTPASTDTGYAVSESAGAQRDLQC
ncbi:hypothetical protein E4V99_16285 [Microbacterium sp. dk485]|uniref:hypothetical protein n=1 Tax=Microbacterium sp. dk485 TaxID=2560021 RepID=UPI001072F6F5|nr:hypothetical protein [Microbacterium sp. dk485]TFV82453.1 hypothetical protein E4V99_16285 [Microbacterium sp. dk485]